MNIQNDNRAGNAATTTTGRGRRWLMAAALAVAAAGSGLAYGGADLPGHFGHEVRLPADPAAMAAHVDKMVERLAADATPEQRAQLASIAKAAMTDLRPLHEQLRQGHARMHALLMAPTIDRAALEQLRAGQMQLLDLASRRILAAVEDAADVLTPEQRAKFARQLHAHMR